MKTSKQRLQTKSELSVAQRDMNISIHTTRAKTPTKRTGGRQRKNTGRNDTCSIEKDKQSPSKIQVVPEKLPAVEVCFPEKPNPIPQLKQDPTETSHSSPKIKLQLFPIDVATQKALDEGGYNPYLELTLSKQKKISSVVKRLESKWGSVYHAGEIMLYPYNVRLEDLADCRRWTSEDTDTCAADVYQAIGSPNHFRLRYGWVHNVEPKTLQRGLENVNVKGVGTSDDDIAGFEKQQNGTVSKECTLICTSDSPNVVRNEVIQPDRAEEIQDNPRVGLSLAPSSSIWTDSLTNISIGALLSEASLHAATNRNDSVAARSDLPNAAENGCIQSDGAVVAQDNPRQSFAPSSSLWTDALTNISIGGLLSESSFHAATNQNDSVAARSDLPNAAENECIQSDRAVVAQDNPRQSFAPSSSLWTDALTNISIGGLLSESSLHAATNRTDSVAARSDACLQQIPFSCDSFDAAIAAHIYRHSQNPQRAPTASHSSILDAEETCHAFPCRKFAASNKDVATTSTNAPVSFVKEGNIQAAFTQNPSTQETQADSLPHMQEKDYVSSSPAVPAVNWADSLGPFDLGLSSSRRLTSGESISLSGFLANSLDAFQSFSLFGRDTSLAPTEAK